MSELRLPYYDLSKEEMAGFAAVRTALKSSTLEQSIIELVFLRVSQINGCSYCLHLHSKALRASGVQQDKLDTLAGWRLSPSFSEAEKAALAWAESVTFITPRQEAPDADFLPLKKHFSDEQISDLTCAIALMNAYNRLAVSMKQ